MKYRISVHGCDDSTVVEMALTNSELALLICLAKLINATATYSCMPNMRIETAEQPPKDIV